LQENEWLFSFLYGRGQYAAASSLATGGIGMRRFVVVLMALFLTAGFCGMSGVALAQDQVAGAKDVYGSITFVDPRARKLIIASVSDEGQKETVLIVDDASVIEKDGRAATLVDLSTGDDVIANYGADDKGQNIAARIAASSQQ
jgi:hypothetical protein